MTDIKISVHSLYKRLEKIREEEQVVIKMIKEMEEKWSDHE